MSSDPPDGTPGGEAGPKALASSRTESVDVYEERFMQGGGRVLHRDKSVLRWHWVLLFFALAALSATILIALGLDPNATPGWAVVPGLATLLFGFCWVGLTVVRSVVTEYELYVQYGLWGPRVPIEAIERAEVIEYDWSEYGGWGIKRNADGVWAYVTTGGDVVKIHYVHPATGKQTAVVFSADDPHGVVGSIRRARVARQARLRSEQAQSLRVEQSDVVDDSAADGSTQLTDEELADEEPAEQQASELERGERGA